MEKLKYEYESRNLRAYALYSSGGLPLREEKPLVTLASKVVGLIAEDDIFGRKTKMPAFRPRA